MVDAELPIEATGLLVSSCSTVIGESVPRVLIDDSNGAKNWDVSAAYALQMEYKLEEVRYIKIKL